MSRSRSTSSPVAATRSSGASISSSPVDDAGGGSAVAGTAPPNAEVLVLVDGRPAAVSGSAWSGWRSYTLSSALPTDSPCLTRTMRRGRTMGKP